MQDPDRAGAVLIVDDEPANIKVLREILKNDYEIYVATGGEAALEIAAKSPPDLILLDIMMPEMDGYEVCRRLKADPALEGVPVVFVTAMDQERDETAGLELGAVDYLTKPVAPSIVRARVRNHVALKKARERLTRQNEELVAAAALREDVERISRHDLKSPLTGIIGLPRILLDAGGLTSDQEVFLKMIEDAGYKMLGMINLSLDLFRMERGTYESRPEDVNLMPILEKCLTELGLFMEDKALRADIRENGRPAGFDDVFMVRCEPLLCYSMLANLLKNAVEAAPEGTALTVDLDREGDGGVIAIHNAGTVPPEIRERFFEKYATAGKFRGTGLGTYSARLMAETQGGGVSMTTSEEKGTTITVRLPA